MTGSPAGASPAGAPTPPPPSAQFRDALSQDRVMAIIRYRAGGDVFGAIEALARGGIRAVEVTVDSPGAWDAIERAAARPELLVGAGTVTDISQVEKLANLGGRFVVSPGFDADIVKAALDHGLDPLPGVATGTEVLAARRAGATFLKLFPAGALGVRYLAALRGPFERESFVPTGGISIADTADWLRAGAFAVALGSELAGRAAPATNADLEAITERARAALNLAAATDLAGARA